MRDGAKVCRRLLAAGLSVLRQGEGVPSPEGRAVHGERCHRRRASDERSDGTRFLCHAGHHYRWRSGRGVQPRPAGTAAGILIEEYIVEMTWDGLKQILDSVKTIAVVGLSNKPDRPSYDVASYLQRVGYRIIPVNPTITEVLGERAYKSLREIPDRVDVVQIFRRPQYVPSIVEDAIAIGAKAVWMQPGTENEEAAARAEAAGLQAVVGACMMTVHRIVVW